MPRPATGRIVEKTTKRGTSYALRFRALGERQFLHLGYDDEGWTHGKAAGELRYVLAQVERGAWQPPAATPEVTPPPADPTFHEFASQWFAEREPEWRPATQKECWWALTEHLLPFFARLRLSEITIAEVDRYRAGKVREGTLAASSINKTLQRLGQVLDVAVERELMLRNPLRVNPRNRKVKAQAPQRPYLDCAEHIAALLEAAHDVDRAAGQLGRAPLGRRAMVATLTLAGLRVGELCALRWHDVDLAAGRLTVGEAKTDAGRRRVDLLPQLRDELATWKASRRPSGNAFVFASSTGQPRDRHMVRERVVKRAADLASERLVAAGGVPLPRLTPHALRRTFASLLLALGNDPAYVMDQLGHTDATFTLRVYAQVMRHGQAERDALRALVEGYDSEVISPVPFSAGSPAS